MVCDSVSLFNLRFAQCDISLTSDKSLRLLGSGNTPNALGSGIFSTSWHGGLVWVLKHWRPGDSDSKCLLQRARSVAGRLRLVA